MKIYTKTADTRRAGIIAFVKNASNPHELVLVGLKLVDELFAHGASAVDHSTLIEPAVFGPAAHGPADGEACGRSVAARATNHVPAIRASIAAIFKRKVS